MTEIPLKKDCFKIHLVIFLVLFLGGFSFFLKSVLGVTVNLGPHLASLL